LHNADFTREEDQDREDGGSSLEEADGGEASAEGRRRRGAAYDVSSFPEVLGGPCDGSAAKEEAMTAAAEGGSAALGTPGPARRAYFEGDWVEEWLEAD
jgi:hypothetical protein